MGRGQDTMGKSPINKNTTGYTMLIPASILFVLINIAPFIYGFILSFTDTNYLRPNSGQGFVGLQNFYDIVFNDPEFYGVLIYSFIYTIGVVILSYALGLLLAVLLNRDIKFRGLFRALALLPWLMPSVVAVVVWQTLLNDQVGIINGFMQNIGLIDKPIQFLAAPQLARIVVIITAVWKTYPFMMVVLLAGLQSIGDEMYEPAYIDGAGPLKVFRYITMPLLKPVTLIAISLMFIWTFNTLSFDNIYLLTRGGPANATFVLSIQTYYTAFFRGKIGYASAISIVMLLTISVIIIVYTVWKKRKDEVVI